MTRFHGLVGFGPQVEIRPGVFDDVVTERAYFGDVVRNLLAQSPTENVNNDLSVSNAISIIADAYAEENFSSIRYVEWIGVRWAINNVEIQRPRLLLRLGRVYNGPTP